MIWIVGSDETLEIGKQMLTLKGIGGKQFFFNTCKHYWEKWVFYVHGQLFNLIFNYIQNVADCEYDSDQE